MTFMVWNPYLETGIGIVDQQHRGLVDMLNQAAPLLAQSSRESLRDIAPLLDGLLDYAATHFKTEEDMMSRLNMDPRASEHHHASHAMFAQQVTDMVRAYSTEDGVTGDRLLSFLASWLVLHILGEDQAMARQVRALEAGAGPEQAYEQGRGGDTSPHPAAMSDALVDIYTTLNQQNRELLLTNRDLDASRAEIQQHNANLEHLVHQRTEQLEQLAEDLRQARDAAEAGSRAKTRFLGTMSHELRTPMNAILGYSRLLRDTGLPAAERDLARRIVEASDHLLELINGVVEFSRLDEGQVEAQETDFPPLGLLTEASRRACQAAAGKGLVCKCEVDPALPTMLRGDAGLITRILAQFAENAVKFTLHGGVRLRAKRIGDSEDGRIKLRFLVEDSGIGIAPVDQARLFKPFSQLDDRPDRQFEGIGLGLALTQRWAGILGGTVGVDSAPGKGSRFWLELTLAAGNDTVAAEPVTPAEEEKSAKPAEPAKPEVVAAPLPTGELPTDLLSRLAQIEALLNAFDTRAGTVLREAAPLLRRHLGTQVDELERLIAAFDYDQALERLKSFSRQGKTTP
jgi:hemerythrin-like metal-binding protein